MAVSELTRRGTHTEWAEDLVTHKVAPEHAGHPANDDAEQGIAGAAVALELSRLELERLSGGADHLALRIIAAPIEQGVLRDAGGVGEEMPDGHLRPHGFSLGQVAGDGIIELETTLLRQPHDGGCGELLGERAHHIDGAVGGRDALLQVGKAVSTREEHAVAPQNGDRHAGDPLAGQLGPDEPIDGVGGGRRLCRQAAREGEEGRTPGPGHDTEGAQRDKRNRTIAAPGTGA